jgi:hypothetical protein
LNVRQPSRFEDDPDHYREALGCFACELDDEMHPDVFVGEPQRLRIPSYQGRDPSPARVSQHNNRCPHLLVGCDEVSQIVSEQVDVQSIAACAFSASWALISSMIA